MGSLHQTASLPIRQHNKESDWSSFCNNVFEQYLDDDDLFGIDSRHSRNRSSSDDSGQNLFDFSGSSEQSNHTADTSPIPSWEHAGLRTPLLEAQQPQAKESVGFWQRTLRALEKNAAESEQKSQKLRTAKSHPDFLSLGGHPSPPVVPPSPTDQSLPVQRRRVSRPAAANGKKSAPASANRSVSRGRPSGVIKTTSTAGAANPHATVRKVSASPHKMMNPSRYRAGFKDVWADKLEHSADSKKYQIRVPSHAQRAAFPVSPPSSARVPQDEFPAFGSTLAASQFAPIPAYDAELSPLTTSFQQQARIHTPVASPLFEPQDGISYFEAVPAMPSAPINPYVLQTVPLNDTSPAFPERTSSLAANRIGSFDFGFGSTSTDTESWAPNVLPGSGPVAQYSNAAFNDPFTGLDHSILPTIEHHDPLATGLGISCDPALVSAPYNPSADIAPLPDQECYVTPTPYPQGLPTTPHRRSRPRSVSPSPPSQNPAAPAAARAGPRARARDARPAIAARSPPTARPATRRRRTRAASSTSRRTTAARSSAAWRLRGARRRRQGGRRRPRIRGGGLVRRLLRLWLMRVGIWMGWRRRGCWLDGGGQGLPGHGLMEADVHW